MPETIDSLARQYIGNKSLTLSNANNTFSITGLPIQPRQTFFKALESWEANIALQSLWMVLFSIPKVVTDEMMKSVGEQPAGQPWNVDGSRKALFTDPFQKLMGCIIAQDVGTPGEGIDMQYVGTENRGFIPSPVITKRESYKPLVISFLETNVSIVDSLIRPWNVARPGTGAIPYPAKTDIFVINLSRIGTDLVQKDGEIVNQRGLIPRKIWTFQNCFPISVDEESYTYDTDIQLTRRKIPFAFQRYQVHTPQSSINLAQAINSQDSSIAVRNAVKRVGKSPQANSSVQQKNNAAAAARAGARSLGFIGSAKTSAQQDTAKSAAGESGSLE